MSENSSRDFSTDPPRAAAIIVAGGRGSRMDPSGLPKQYRELMGTPMLLWSVRTLSSHPRIHHTVVVLPPDDAARPPPWLQSRSVSIVAGGATRGESVRLGLEAVPVGYDVALIHDGARPFVSNALVERVLSAVVEGGVIAAVKVTETVKRSGPDSMIAGTVDRADLWLAQTPQAFPLECLRDLYRRAAGEDWSGTDDAALCERYGVPVRLVEGEAENIKITTESDFRMAATLARSVHGTGILD
jgi:2-C-methyl-D-erythritol 4-phosphate cytidylyltransferase